MEQRKRERDDVTDHSYAGGITNSAGNPVIQLLNQVTRGSATNQRLGRTIFMKNLQVRAEIFPNGTGVNRGFTRFMIVLDSRPNKSSYPEGELLLFQRSRSLTNRDNDSRFVILYDRVFGVTTGQAPECFFLDLDIPINAVAEWTSDNTDGTISGFLNNALFLHFISGDNLFMQVSMQTRLFFDP